MLMIDIERTGETTFVRCAGRLVRGPELGKLHRVVASMQNAQMIFLDLSEVEALDAGGVNALVGLRQWASGEGIQLKLVSPSRFVRETLTRFRLDQLLEISSLQDVLAFLVGRESAQLAAASSI
jgi:anti-anti-sigma factor